MSSKDEIINQNKLIGNREDDLLVVFTIESHYYLVGVIQAKTSVRERMKTDAAHSQLMLKSGLWSIHVTIDPDNFLRNPKFRKLADGTSELGRVWHGVYKLSSLVAESTGIFDFNKLGTHLEQAIQITLQNKMSQGWHPE